MFFKIKKYDKKFTEYHLTDYGIETVGYFIAIVIGVAVLVIGEIIKK